LPPSIAPVVHRYARAGGGQLVDQKDQVAGHLSGYHHVGHGRLSTPAPRG
jgi:hypothetical protein